MRAQRILCAAIAAAVVPAGVASGITHTFVQVPITATTDSVTPSPGIANYTSFDLLYTVDVGDPARAATILWDPPTQIFHHALGNNASPFGPPFSAFIPVFPVLEFDSYLQNYDNRPLNVLGSASTGTPPGIFNNDRVDVFVADFWDPGVPGTFRLARFTVEGTSIPSFPTVTFFVPEPSAIGLLATAAPLFLRRRRRAYRLLPRSDRCR